MDQETVQRAFNVAYGFARHAEATAETLKESIGKLDTKVERLNEQILATREAQTALELELITALAEAKKGNEALLGFEQGLEPSDPIVTFAYAQVAGVAVEGNNI
jgi:chromosome segregation ATPase